MLGTHENIKRLREEQGISQESLAVQVGYKDRSSIAKVEAGLVDLSQSKIAAFAKALHVTPGQLMGFEDSDNAPPPPSNILPLPKTYKAPRLGTIACGEPILAEQNIEGYDQVPDYVKCDFTLVCKGDSMINARIYDGDIVCIKRAETVESGQIAAVLIDGEFDAEATLKRVRFMDNGIALWPENPTYAPLIFTGPDVERVHIIGLATHFISTVK